MALWLMRAGKNGEYEQKFIDNHRFYITWDGLNLNLKTFENKEKLQQELSVIYPDEKTKTLQQWASQLWRAANEINIGDWIVLPSKTKSSIYVGEVI
jgi:restriction system protein